MPSTSIKMAACATLLILLIPSAMSLGSSTTLGEPDPSVLDPYLIEVMATTGAYEEMEVVIQFKDHVLPQDRDLLRREGIETLHEYHVLPAVWAKATPRQVERLSGYDRTRWVEYNRQLEYHMDETTRVVNATRTWYSKIEGSLWGSGGINGKGVTAVVLDSGIDAGHPDLDYGTKTIMNLKSDSGTGPWYEIENGDTSSGHGTHCAGTVGGNGDASAGQRKGVAPGANLIGLSAGELVMITGALGGLEWVYDHSKPGNNPHNIRVVSNSWGGGGGQYNPQNSISQVINRLTYENNVAVCFSAGNSDGDGNTIQSSVYGNTPAALCIAASTRDGTGITSFSSKGQWDWVDTWPDITAPGQNIQSTAARRTIIGLLSRGTTANPYYFAISGTSMSCPHVAGLAALIFQAAPSLRVSEVRQDVGVISTETGGYVVTYPEEGSHGNLAYPYEEWWEAPDTRIHEVELIIKLTADYTPPGEDPNSDANGLTDNYVVNWSVPGTAGGRMHDFSQGYGLINAHRAIGLALAVERIRWDYPDATVLDAYSVFEDIFDTKEKVVDTDVVSTYWQVTLSYRPVNTAKLTAGALGFMIDTNDDGSWEHTSSLSIDPDGVVSQTFTVSDDLGLYWKFGIQGEGFRLQRPTQGTQYHEARIPFDLSVVIHFPSASGTIVTPEQDLHAIVGHLRFEGPSDGYTGGNISIVTDYYNLNNVQWSPDKPIPSLPEEQGSWFWWIVLLIVLLAVAAYALARFWPESMPGRNIRRTAKAIGLVAAIGLARRLLLKVTRPVFKLFKRGKVKPKDEGAPT
jgi:serine protease AprX